MVIINTLKKQDIYTKLKLKMTPKEKQLRKIINEILKEEHAPQDPNSEMSQPHTMNTPDSINYDMPGESVWDMMDDVAIGIDNIIADKFNNDDRYYNAGPNNKIIINHDELIELGLFDFIQWINSADLKQLNLISNWLKDTLEVRSFNVNPRTGEMFVLL